MTSIRKKQIIAGVLLLSSVLLVFLLLSTQRTERPSLRDIAEIDTLIYRELAAFNIGQDHIRSRTRRVDSAFSRVEHFVSVPPRVSKTFIHSEIHQQVQDFGINDPAVVEFPQKDLRIHFLKQGTIVRSLTLRTDTALVFRNYPVRVFFFTSSSPDVENAQKIHDLGEHLPLMLKTNNPDEAESWFESVNDIISPVYVWLHDPDQTAVEMLNNEYWLNERIPRIANISSNVQIMINQPGKNVPLKRSVRSLLNQYDVMLLSTSDMLTINKEISVYNQERIREQFVQRAISDQVPLLSIALSEKNAEWITKHQKEFKKMGIAFYPFE